MEEEDITRVLANYFNNIFQTSYPSGIAEITSLVADRLSAAHVHNLSLPYSGDEVEEALFQMHPTKALGPDGMHALFYQKFWHIICGDVSSLCLHV